MYSWTYSILASVICIISMLLLSSFIQPLVLSVLILIGIYYTTFSRRMTLPFLTLIPALMCFDILCRAPIYTTSFYALIIHTVVFYNRKKLHTGGLIEHAKVSFILISAILACKVIMSISL